jgi:ATP-dependent helicase/nuclease subunit B
MQLPVYLSAVLNNANYFKKVYSIDRIVPAGILYYNIDDPIIKTNYNTSKEEIQKLVNNQLMLKGLVLDREDVVKAMDINFSSSSDIINVKRNKDGSFSKKSDIISIEDFNLFSNYTTFMLENIVKGIGKGAVDRIPVYKGKYTGCDYCSYKSLCGFDPSIRGCTYNFLRSGLKEEEIRKLMEDKINEEKQNGADTVDG